MCGLLPHVYRMHSLSATKVSGVLKLLNHYPSTKILASFPCIHWAFPWSLPSSLELISLSLISLKEKKTSKQASKQPCMVHCLLSQLSQLTPNLIGGQHFQGNRQVTENLYFSHTSFTSHSSQDQRSGQVGIYLEARDNFA